MSARINFYSREGGKTVHLTATLPVDSFLLSHFPLLILSGDLEPNPASVTNENIFGPFM